MRELKRWYLVSLPCQNPAKFETMTILMMDFIIIDEGF